MIRPHGAKIVIRTRRLTTLLVFAGVLFSAGQLAAQQNETTPQAKPEAQAETTPPANAQEGTEATEAIEEAAPTKASAESYPVKVKVTRGDKPLANAAVFLRAARPKGPFEPTDPKPEWEATGTTDAQGLATFAEVPKKLAKQGLRLHAVAALDGMTFKSAQVTPAANITLPVKTFDRGYDVSTFKVASLRMIVEPWEDYLVFTQMWSITVNGDRALDTRLLADPDYENGIPLELPLKAQGINVNTPGGETKVVNSTVYFKGVLQPGDPVTLQVRYSMPANSAEFVYEQPVGFPIDNFELIVPIETNFQDKLPRLENLGLRAPGFKPENIRTGFDIPGLRPDKEFLYATRANLEPGQPLLLQLFNLPYKRPPAPWIALGMGIIGALLVLLFAAKEKASGMDRAALEKLRASLVAERDGLLTEILALERDADEDMLSERDFEREDARLRGRVAIIIAKIEELDSRLGREPGKASA